METNLTVYPLLASFVTSLMWYIYVVKLKAANNSIKSDYNRLNSNLDREVSYLSDTRYKTLEKQLNELKLTLTEAKIESFREGYEKAKKEFSIRVFPYKQEHRQGDEGWLINDIQHEIILGYQYQLFLNGIPILQPAIVVEEVLSEQKREVDYRKINAALEAIEAKLLPIIAQSKGLIKFIKR